MDPPQVPVQAGCSGPLQRALVEEGSLGPRLQVPGDYSGQPLNQQPPPGVCSAQVRRLVPVRVWGLRREVCLDRRQRRLPPPPRLRFRPFRVRPGL